MFGPGLLETELTGACVGSHGSLKNTDRSRGGGLDNNLKQKKTMGCNFEYDVDIKQVI